MVGVITRGRRSSFVLRPTGPDTRSSTWGTRNQLQERNQSLDLAEHKMGVLQEQVCELNRHLERERGEKQDLYYKTRERRDGLSTSR